MEQQSPEWFAARRGIPTASGYSNLLTPLGKLSASHIPYMGALLSEWLGVKENEFSTASTEHGNEVEPEALSYYSFVTDKEVKPVGFISKRDGMTGGSPDGLTETGGIEIKCPKSHTHMKYHVEGVCPKEYYAQVQGYIWLTDSKEWDFMSYHQELPEFLITVKRDDAYIKSLETELAVFIEKLLKLRAKLKGAE